jgi:hypothetical protein
MKLFKPKTKEEIYKGLKEQPTSRNYINFAKFIKKEKLKK